METFLGILYIGLFLYSVIMAVKFFEFMGDSYGTYNKNKILVHFILAGPLTWVISAALFIIGLPLVGIICLSEKYNKWMEK